MVSGVIDASFTEWHSILREGIGQLFMSTVLLDHHQEVLGTPSEGNTLPCINNSNLPPMSYLEFTWSNHQSTRHTRY